MTPLLVVFALLAPPAVTPPPGKAAPVTVVAPTLQDQAAEAAKTAEQMQDMYMQSCGSREYGAYDDICNVLNGQLKEAKRNAVTTARQAAEAERARAAPR